jgi:hypothetical protein
MIVMGIKTIEAKPVPDKKFHPQPRPSRANFAFAGGKRLILENFNIVWGRKGRFAKGAQAVASLGVAANPLVLASDMAHKAWLERKIDCAPSLIKLPSVAATAHPILAPERACRSDSLG